MIDTFEAVALRPSIMRQQWLPPEVAMREIVEFGKRFGLEHLLLACHAALPSNLTPELINLVRINFLNYRGEDCPWIAEADFLLSALCRSVDDTLFEVEPMVREILLAELERRYGWQRLQEMAAFLLQYLKASQEHKVYPGVAQVQEWIAYSYLKPDRVVQELTDLLAQSIAPEKDAQNTQYKKIQLATTMEIVAGPLKHTAHQQEYQHLIHSTRAFARVLYGGKELPQLTTSAEQPALSEDTGLDTLFPSGVQQWIRSIAPAPTITTGGSAQKSVLAPVEVMEDAVIGSEVERLLTLAGWNIQDYARADIRNKQGVAIRNFPIRLGMGDAEPLNFLVLFVDQQTAGIVVIVEDEQNLIGIEQSLALSRNYPLLQGEKVHRDPLPFTYETNTRGTRVRFTNYLDLMPRTRSVFAFHRPETLSLWLQQAPANVAKSRTNLLRARLRNMPAFERTGLRDVQYDAIVALEKSLAENRQRALIQMASRGSGKTYTLISSIYRLLKFGNAQRILYLTDTPGRSEYALAAFRRHQIPDEGLFPSLSTLPGSTTFPRGGTFAELYNVQLTSDISTPDVQVQISSILSLIPQLFQESTLKQYHKELSVLVENWLAFSRKSTSRIVELLSHIRTMLIDVFDSHKLEQDAYFLTDEQRDMLRNLLAEDLDMEKLTPEILTDYVELIGDLLLHGVSVSRRTMQYNPELPIDAFDIVIIDECTRQIIDQAQLRSVLEYFDAFLVGVTEEGDPKVVNFFNNNVVYKQQFPKVPSSEVSGIDICIFCALAEEAEQLKEAFYDASVRVFKDQPPIVFKRYYNRHIKRNYDYTTITNEAGEQLSVLVIWQPENGPMGQVLQLHSLLGEFNPLFVAMTGICAGDRERVQLGDIIVADRAFSYDVGRIISGEDSHPELQRDTPMWTLPTEVLRAVRGFSNWKQIVAQEPRPPSLHQQRDWLLNRLLDPDTLRVDDIPQHELEEHVPDLQTVVRELQKSSSNTYLTSDKRLKDSDRVRELYLERVLPFKDPEQPTVYIAPIASGSAIRADNPFEEISMPVRGTIAIDIEGAVFYRTMSDFRDIRYLLVKGVADYADGDKDDSYHEYATKVSALYLLAFLREYVTDRNMSLREGDKGAAEYKEVRKRDRNFPTAASPAKRNVQRELSLFCCYAPEDERYFRALERHLVLLITGRGGPIRKIYTSNIALGSSIDAATVFLERSQIILLLISADFIANDDIYEKQLMKAIEMQREGIARVIPILLRPTNYEGLPLQESLILPRNYRPISQWKNIDEAFYEVFQEIRTIIEDFEENQK